jgi:hypothetical protein
MPCSPVEVQHRFGRRTASIFRVEDMRSCFCLRLARCFLSIALALMMVTARSSDILVTAARTSELQFCLLYCVGAKHGVLS